MADDEAREELKMVLCDILEDKEDWKAKYVPEVMKLNNK